MRLEEMAARLEMLEREVKVSGEALEKLKSDLVCEVEVLKADVTATKRFLTSRHPELSAELEAEYKRLRDEVCEEMGLPGKKIAA